MNSPTRRKNPDGGPAARESTGVNKTLNDLFTGKTGKPPEGRQRRTPDAAISSAIKQNICIPVLTAAATHASQWTGSGIQLHSYYLRRMNYVLFNLYCSIK